MKIALIGYGKMGKIIDEIATGRGHDVVARLNETPDAGNLNNADVAIEFSQPEAAFKCKRHSLIAPFAGALIPVRTIGLVQQSHCKNTVNYAILSKIR